MDFPEVHDIPTEVSLAPVWHQILQNANQLPGSVAVKNAFSSQEFTYGELQHDATRLASYLQSLGVSINSRVALVFGRNYDTIVALLATWLSGASYVAVDSAYPESRIEYVLHDSEAKVVLTSPANHHLVPASYEGTVINIDNGKILDTAAQSIDESAYKHPDTTTETLACVWYTSGTSGKPKGVLIDHGAFAHAVRNIPSYPGFGPGCCFGQISSPCYPGHLADIWKPLSMGATLVIIPTQTLMDPPAMANVLAKMQISAIIFTPKILELYADVAPDALSTLTLIQFAGERIRLDAVLKLAQAVPEGTLLQHLYGCTEHCSIIAWLGFSTSPETIATLKAQTDGFGRLPVGRCCQGVKVYILDPDTLEELPDGEEGEVFISSRQLALGYNNLPDETNAKFIKLPTTGERVYRTGDIGRTAPCGLGLDLMGRAGGDGMVKINGFRIELGEIEAAAMAQEPEATAAIATVWKANHLVLYVIPGFIDTDRLKERLKEVLPQFMVPAFIEALPFLPLNVSGKVDRAALPSPENAVTSAFKRSISIVQREKGAAATDPATDLELDIIELFSEVLQVSARAMNPLSSFVGLGGHSLLAMSLLSKLRKQTNCPDLQLTELLSDDCPKHLASVIERHRSAGRALPEEVQQISTGMPGETPVWVVPGGQGRPRVGLVVGRTMKRRPCYTLEMTDALAQACAAHPKYPIEGCLDFFIQRMKQVQEHGPYIVAGNRLAYALAHALEQMGDQVQRLIILDDNPLWFDRKLVESTVTQRDQRGFIGMFKFAVLKRVFPEHADHGDSSHGNGNGNGTVADRTEQELDIYEEKYNKLMEAGGNPCDLVASEVARWLGEEEGARWDLGLKTLIPILAGTARPCARFGQDVLNAPISVIKAADSWSFNRIQDIYDPAGKHDYSWSSFTGAGPVDVHVVDANHYNMGYDEVGAVQLAQLLDSV